MTKQTRYIQLDNSGGSGANILSQQTIITQSIGFGDTLNFTTATSLSPGNNVYSFYYNTDTFGTLGMVATPDAISGTFIPLYFPISISGSQSAGSMGSVALGSYVYVFAQGTGLNYLRCDRADAGTLATVTAMTIANINFNPACAFTNGIDLFVLNTSGTCRQYSVSGTTLTFVQLVTGGPSGVTAAYAEGSTVYFGNSSTWYEYTLSGSTLTLVTSTSRRNLGGEGTTMVGFWYTTAATLAGVYNYSSAFSGIKNISQLVSVGYSRL